MITWLAFKVWAASAWKSFIEFCRERWELLVGVLVGVLGMLTLTRGSRDAAKALEEKNKLIDTLIASEQDATEKEREALKKNLENFLSANEEAEEKFREKMESLDEEKKNSVKEILKSESPEEEIARRLREYLD